MKGLLGKQVLTADTPTTVYQTNVPISYADVNINIINPTANDATISVSISMTPNALTDVDYIERNLVLTGDGSSLIRSAEIMSPGEAVVVNSNVAGLIVRVSGKEHTN